MNYQFEDREVACLDCGVSFAFSAEDQEFFAQKGYSEPKRCPACRAARKANSSRGGGGRSGGGSRGGYGGGERPQYRVTCSACGCDTTVPFEPKGGRPVYCSDCYRNG
jgi:CxxC-x17-CxxC domain-containing protein